MTTHSARASPVQTQGDSSNQSKRAFHIYSLLLQDFPLSLFTNRWCLPQTFRLHCPRLLGLDGLFWIFVVELLARFFRRRFACFSVDILLDTSHDLLQDVFYESMLRWCFSGLFPFALAGPPCGDFSRAKLRPGGPKPLRTPEFPFGVPGLSERDQQRVESSHTLLHRVVQILLAVFSTGGHVCLEQPSSAFSWQDPSVQDFLAETAAVCSVVPACCFGLNLTYTRSGFSLRRFRICLSSLANATMLLGNMRIWLANAMNGAVFVLSNLPFTQMVCARQLFRLFGPCFRGVNLLWMFQLHVSAIVFPTPFLSGRGRYSLSAGLVGSAGNRQAPARELTSVPASVAQ